MNAINKPNIMSLINEDENYIYFKNGKAVRQNIKENEIEIEIIDNYDISEICKRQRTELEEKIVSSSPFTTVVNIYKSGTCYQRKQPTIKKDTLSGVFFFLFISI